MLIKLSFIVLVVQVIVRQATCFDISEVPDLPSEGEELEHHETSPLLDELDQVKYPFDSDDFNRLTQLVHENSANCSFSYYSAVEDLEIKYAQHNETIVPLLRRFRGDQFNQCKKGYEQKVEKTVLAMDKEIKDKVRKVCDVSQGKYQDLYQDQVVRLVDYMKNDVTNMNPKLLKNRSQFNQKFEQTVEDICAPYLDNLYDELYIYNMMLPNKDPQQRKSAGQLAKALVDNVPNGHVLLWIIQARMCFLLVDDEQLFSESTREGLRKELRKAEGNWFNSLFSKKSTIQPS